MIKTSQMFDMYCDECGGRLSHPIFNNRIGFKSARELIERAKDLHWYAQKYVDSIYESSDPDASHSDTVKYRNYCPKCANKLGLYKGNTKSVFDEDTIWDEEGENYL